MFHIFGVDRAVQQGLPGHDLWTFAFDEEERPDIQPRPDGLRGNGQWTDVGADRMGYSSAYCFWMHEDPGHHDFLRAIRFFVQVYGAEDGRVMINDRSMNEDPFDSGMESQGVPPYPYETVPAIAPDKSRPGGRIEFLHQRPAYRIDGRVTRRQPLAIFEFPVVSPVNPGLRWYYQLGGLWVAELEGVGVVSRAILSGMHPAYTYRVQGVDTEGMPVP